jgi:hypothetical protein
LRSTWITTIDFDIVMAQRRRGIDVLAARDDGATRLDDERLLERAAALGRILCAEDGDSCGSPRVGGARVMNSLV